MYWFKKTYRRTEQIVATIYMKSSAPIFKLDLPVLVMGSGGHAKVTIDTLHALGANILGIIERESGKKGEILGVSIVGGDSSIEQYDPNDVLLVNGIGSVKPEGSRASLYQKLKNIGYSFASIVHPTAYIGRGVSLAEGVQIMAGAVIQSGTSIGVNSIVNTKASVDHDCRIGRNVHLAPGVVLSGNVEVGDGSHVGIGACVIQNIKIGSNVMIAAGAAVIKMVPDSTTVKGVPAVPDDTSGHN